MRLPEQKVLDFILNKLSYDEREGKLFWKADNGSGVKAGDRAGYLNTDGYRRVKIYKKLYPEHRIIWFLHYKVWPNSPLDHADRNKSNNHISNLREATLSENQRNKLPPKSSSCYKGVYPCGKNTWRARIRDGGRLVGLGSFSSPELAAEAYNIALKKLAPLFAVPNFIGAKV